MTESESVALPFGDSPLFIVQMVLYINTPALASTFFMNFLKNCIKIDTRPCSRQEHEKSERLPRQRSSSLLYVLVSLHLKNKVCICRHWPNFFVHNHFQFINRCTECKHGCGNFITIIYCFVFSIREGFGCICYHL